MIPIKRLLFVPLATVMFSFAGCNRTPEEWKSPNMTALTPRLQPVFEKTKTVCFGRFMVDVPASAVVVWGEASVSLSVGVYPDGADRVEELAKKFIEELKSEKAIYQNDVPLLLAVDHVSQPEGKIVTGYAGFGAINDLKINGYFRLKNDGVVINSLPLRNQKDEVIADIQDIARRLRRRMENEIPAEPGNCIEYAFLADKQNPSKEDLMEHIQVGFRLKEFPDAHISIYVAPSNPHDPSGDSLEAQWNRMLGEATPEEKKLFANTKFLRKSARRIHDWQTGYEVLVRSPDEEASHSYHDFQIKFIGIPHDQFRPYADIKFQTGVAKNASGATKASLTDDEAIAVWDKITSTIRVRPTGAAALKTTGRDPQPRLPLGELAATGRTCPQTGLWVPGEPSSTKDCERRCIQAGEKMPHVIASSEPSLWQKLKREQPSHRMATVWKLVAYENVPAPVDVAVAVRASQSAESVADNIVTRDAVSGATGDSEREQSSHKG